MKEVTKTRIFAWVLLLIAFYFILGATMDSLVRAIAIMIAVQLINQATEKQLKEDDEIDRLD